MTRMVVGLGLLFLCLAGEVLIAPAVMSAEEHSIDLNNPDAIKLALEQQVGKRVKIKLLSGQDLEGKVLKVGSHALHLGELSGMEFFDATVRVEHVAAVVVRVRAK